MYDNSTGRPGWNRRMGAGAAPPAAMRPKRPDWASRIGTPGMPPTAQASQPLGQAPPPAAGAPIPPGFAGASQAATAPPATQNGVSGIGGPQNFSTPTSQAGNYYQTADGWSDPRAMLMQIYGGGYDPNKLPITTNPDGSLGLGTYKP